MWNMAWCGTRSVSWMYLVTLTAVIFMEGCASEAAEYCQHDGFRPSCLDNQVIVTTSAKYGRMKMGDCIKTDFGYMGCSVDVLADINALCSGTRGCVVPVPNAAFDEAKPCHAELHSYLEVDYHCANVTMPEWESCYSNSTNNVTTSGYLASVVTKETGCGNEFSPWTLLALPGQRFNITLMDFKRKMMYNTRTSSTDAKRAPATGDAMMESAEQILCKELAIIEEEDIKTPLSSCEGNGVIDPGGTRYTSMGHNVTLYLRSRALDDGAQFIVKYEIIGCPDIEANKATWVTRDGDKVSVGCVATDLTWHMTCAGTEWQGEPGNCSAGEMKKARKEGDGASVVIILVVSGVVGVLVLLVGLFCMKKYRARRSLRGDVPMKDIRPLNQDDNYEQDVLYARNNAFMPSRIRFGKQKLNKKKKGDPDHDYEYVWDMSGVSKSAPGTDGTMQTSACVVSARNTPKSPRAAHASPDSCHCPEIHVHVHHTTENRAEGGQAQVSRVHIQARADTMPRMATSFSRTPGSSRRDSNDGAQTPGTLRAIQAPPETPSRNRKCGEPSSHKHTCDTVDRRKARDTDHQHHHHHHCKTNSDPDGPSKRYWTLPVKSAFKAKQHKQQQKLPSPKESTG